jgi:hypothetical protein
MFNAALREQRRFLIAPFQLLYERRNFSALGA